MLKAGQFLKFILYKQININYGQKICLIFGKITRFLGYINSHLGKEAQLYHHSVQ